MMQNMITIEVAYATPKLQKVLLIEVDANTTVLAAIEQSGIITYFPELHQMLKYPEQLHIGIFAKKIDLNTYKLKSHDRIEIYRPLAKTPNQRRLERAQLNSI